MIVNEKDKFQVAVDYISEYNGVKIAVIFDNEGLVIAQSSPDGSDGEDIAAAGLGLINQMDNHIVNMINPGCEQLSVKTKNDWVSIVNAGLFYIVVLAERRVDDLLNVRVQRSVDMITKHFNDNYQAVKPSVSATDTPLTKETEASYV